MQSSYRRKCAPSPTSCDAVATLSELCAIKQVPQFFEEKDFKAMFGTFDTTRLTNGTAGAGAITAAQCKDGACVAVSRRVACNADDRHQLHCRGLWWPSLLPRDSRAGGRIRSNKFGHRGSRVA
jgi:hypothetical protein